eukprot:TRINITY_DN4176_c0_g1_i3.p1 TRINITY_DN4176_c0_g1~~TRINITY_DN4176_c0_g1_i3.p1  ORF type:complete len:248 (+),score=49.92 TRINITY_DN4176_c0_g1_i3:137-880(+)
MSHNNQSIKDIRATLQANDPRTMAANTLQAAYERTCNELKIKLNEEHAAHVQLKAKMETDLLASTGERAQAARWKAQAEKADHEASAWRAELDKIYKELERERVVNKHMADALQEAQRKAHAPSMSHGSSYPGQTTPPADRPSAPATAYLTTSASTSSSTPAYAPVSASTSALLSASTSAHTSVPIYASSYVPTTPISLPSFAPAPSTSDPSAAVDPGHFARSAVSQHVADDMACYNGQNDIKIKDR